MFYLTKKWYDDHQKKHQLLIPESDEIWDQLLEEEPHEFLSNQKQELRELKEELLSILPTQFHPYVENETLNQPELPKTVREEYLAWLESCQKEMEAQFNLIYKEREKALPFLTSSGNEVFKESFHDGIVERIVRKDNNLHLYLDLSGGFSKMQYVELIFSDVMEEEPLMAKSWWIHDELRKTEEGFGLRVLFEGFEWTIFAKNIEANYFFRPVSYFDWRYEEKEFTFEEFLENLHMENVYYFITPDFIAPLSNIIEEDNITFTDDRIIVMFGGSSYHYFLEDSNPISFIYCESFEDAEAKFVEPVPLEELVEAARSSDLEVKVRAWNMMYANPKELRTYIHEVLWNLDISEEDEMFLSVFVTHFQREGVLTNELKTKFKEVLQ